MSALFKNSRRSTRKSLKKYRDADNFEFWGTDAKMADGTAYYVEFNSKDLEDNESFYYAFVDQEECRLFDDGFEMVNSLQVLYERRRNFWQRVRDFNLPDIIGAFIAIVITLAFAISLTIEGTNGISKEFLAVFSLILGYYFGRNQGGR